MKVLVFGTFDELHPGHIFFLSEARRRGKLTVVVARDANVEMIKKHKPFQSELERLRAVKAAVPDARVIFGSESGNFLEPVRMISPEVILLGYDQNLPPGVSEADLSCPIERVPSFEPGRYKSSLRRR